MIALYISEKAVLKEIEDKPRCRHVFYVIYDQQAISIAALASRQPQLTIYGVAVLDVSLLVR